MIDLDPELFRKADRIQSVAYMAVASAVVVFYDYILTFQNEVALLRGGKITLPKLFFAITRYSAIAIMSITMFSLSPSAPGTTMWCRIETLLINVLTLIFQTCIGVTMGMKTAALWNGHRKVVASIWIAFVAMFLLCYTTFTLVTISLYKNIYYSPEMHTCLVDRTPAIAWAIPASELLYDTLITGFLCYMAFLQYHSLSSLNSVPVLKLLLRNGLLYFLLIDSIKFAMSLVWARVREAPLVYGPLWFDIALTASVNSRSLFSLRKSLDPNADRSTTQSRLPLSEAFAVPTQDRFSPDDKPVYKIPQHYNPHYDYEYDFGRDNERYNYHDQNLPTHSTPSQAHLLSHSTVSVPYRPSPTQSSHTLSTPYNPGQPYYPDYSYNSHNSHSPRTPHSHPNLPPNLHHASYPYNMRTPARTSASSSLHTAEDQDQTDANHRQWIENAHGHQSAIPLVDLANSPTTRYGSVRGSITSAVSGSASGSGFGRGVRSSAGSGSRPNTANTVNAVDQDVLNSPGGEPTNLGGRLSTSTTSPTVGLTPIRRQVPNALFTYESYQQDASHTAGTGIAL